MTRFRDGGYSRVFQSREEAQCYHCKQKRKHHGGAQGRGFCPVGKQEVPRGS